jgi:para-aminobenzoate synthetase component 1
MTTSVVPLVEELVPCPDPWDVARKLAHLPHLLFLDSSECGGERGRYSYVMAEPEVFDRTSVGLARIGGKPEPRRDFFKSYSNRLLEESRPLPSELPPFRGGYAGLFGYGIARQLERILENEFDEFRTPDLAVGQYNWVFAFDHFANRSWLLWNDPRTSKLNAYHEKARRRFSQLLTLIRSDEIRPPRPMSDPWFHSEFRTPTSALPGFPGVTSNFSREGYVNAIRRAVDYVHAGDVFQVNISQRLLAQMTEHPLDLYGRLRRVSPAPFACYFDLGDFQIASASPERFLEVSPTGEVSTRPIKGTRPRGKTSAEDAALLHDLTTNPKDRAENVMIVDLLRNDLGRVCEYGSVRVPAVCEVESFRQVHHLVSEVRGKLRPGKTAFDLLRAAFPGGSVTGAPKVRAMEIIAELEPTARGPYCGSIGWIGFDGAMDTNILIRTFTAGRGWLQFPVGGGIVADSDPATEYEETLHKAAGLLRALNR